MPQTAYHSTLSVLLLVTLSFTASGGSISGLTTVGKCKLSTIGCGTWSWGNRFLWQYDTKDDEGLYETYMYLRDRGVNWFDSADSYGTGRLTGRAEELLGQFAARYNKPSKFAFVATKLAPYPWRIGSQSMVSACRESVQRLKKPVDILQLHWPPSLGWQEKEYLQAFARLVQNKEAKQIGLSNYGPKGLEKVYNIAASYKAEIFSNQVQFSLMSRYPITNGLVEKSKELGVQLIGYSPLALGLLTDKYTLDKLPSGPRGFLFKEYLPSMTPLLSELRDIARYRKKTVAQVALNWNIQKGLLVLVGVRSVEQAKENLGALGWALSASEILVIDNAASKVKKQLVQNSFQSQ